MSEERNEKTEQNESELKDLVPQLEERFRVTVWNRLLMLARWLIFAALTGGILGLVGTAFGKGVELATELRAAHSWILFGLPIAGLVIVWMYHWERNRREAVPIWCWTRFTRRGRFP